MSPRYYAQKICLVLHDRDQVRAWWAMVPVEWQALVTEHVNTYKLVQSGQIRPKGKKL